MSQDSEEGVERFMSSNVLGCSMSHNRCTLLHEKISLYFVLRHVLFMFSVSLSLPYFTPQFLNETLLHYIIYINAVYNQISNWLLIC